MTLILSKNCCDCQDVYDNDLGPCDDCDPCPEQNATYTVEVGVFNRFDVSSPVWAGCTYTLGTPPFDYRPQYEGVLVFNKPAGPGVHWIYDLDVAASTLTQFNSCPPGGGSPITPTGTLQYEGFGAGLWKFNLWAGDIYLTTCSPIGTHWGRSAWHHTILNIT